MSNFIARNAWTAGLAAFLILLLIVTKIIQPDFGHGLTPRHAGRNRTQLVKRRQPAHREWRDLAQPPARIGNAIDAVNS